MRSIAEAAFANPPLWYRTLLAIRDRAMSAFGVKSSSQMGRDVPRERRVGFFPIHEFQLMKSFSAGMIGTLISGFPFCVVALTMATRSSRRLLCDVTI
jgi:Protein of unknown function (DUF2867)